MGYKGLALGCITLIIILLIVFSFLYSDSIYESSIILLTTISSIAWVLVYISTRKLTCVETNTDNDKKLICSIKGSREYKIKYGGAVDISDDNKKKLWKIINFLRGPPPTSDVEAYRKNYQNEIILNRLLQDINGSLLDNNDINADRGINFADALLKSIGIKLIENNTDYVNTEDYVFFNVDPDVLLLKPEDAGYTLIGKIVHTPGHYIAYIKKYSSDKWYKIDTLDTRGNIKVTPEVEIDEVNLINDVHIPYIWLYSKQKNGKNGVINRIPFHLLHFNNICYAATPLQLLLATNLIEIANTNSDTIQTTVKYTQDYNDTIILLDQILDNIESKYDVNDDHVYSVFNSIENYKNTSDFADIQDFLNYIYSEIEKLPKITNEYTITTNNKLINQLDNWIVKLNDIEPKIQLDAKYNNDYSLFSIIIDPYNNNNTNNKIDNILQEKIKKLIVKLVTIADKKNETINYYIIQIVMIIGNIYKSNKTNDIILNNTFNQTNIYKINLFINNIKNEILIKDDLIYNSIVIWESIIKKNTETYIIKQQNLITQLTDNISDDINKNTELFKYIINELYNNDIKNNEIIPSNYIYYYPDPKDKKKIKIKFELNTYKEFYNECMLYIQLLNIIKEYDVNKYNELMLIPISAINDTDNDKKDDDDNTNTNTIQGTTSLLECMIKYVDYMNKPFEERMLENVDMIIAKKGPKIKKNSKDIIRYDIQNFMPLEYTKYIYLFHNKNIIEKTELFNIVYKIIKWKSMLENDINLKSLSNEDEGDELIEEENNENLDNYNQVTDPDPNVPIPSIYYIQRQPIRDLIKSKFIDDEEKVLFTNNIRLRKIIIQKAKRLYRLFTKKIEPKDMKMTESEINNFINFINNPFITYDEEDFGSGEPYSSYAHSYSSEKIKKISKRYGTDITPFDEFYKKILHSNKLLS